MVASGPGADKFTLRPQGTLEAASRRHGTVPLSNTTPADRSQRPAAGFPCSLSSSFSKLSLPPTARALLAGGIVLFWLLEGVIPLFPRTRNSWRHAGLNLAFTGLQLVVGFSFAALLLRAADYSTSERFGVLYFVELPLWLHVVLAILLLDSSART